MLTGFRTSSKGSKVKVTIDFTITSIRLTKSFTYHSKIKGEVKFVTSLSRRKKHQNIKNEHTNDSVPRRPPGRSRNFCVRRCLILLPQLLCKLI